MERGALSGAAAAAASPNAPRPRLAWDATKDLLEDPTDDIPVPEGMVMPPAAPDSLPVVEAMAGFAAPQGEPSRLVFHPYMESSASIVTTNDGTQAIVHARHALPGQVVGVEPVSVAPSRSGDMARRLAVSGGVTTVSHAADASTAVQLLAHGMSLSGAPWGCRRVGPDGHQDELCRS